MGSLTFMMLGMGQQVSPSVIQNLNAGTTPVQNTLPPPGKFSSWLGIKVDCAQYVYWALYPTCWKYSPAAWEEMQLFTEQANTLPTPTGNMETDQQALTDWAAQQIPVTDVSGSGSWIMPALVIGGGVLAIWFIKK